MLYHPPPDPEDVLVFKTIVKILAKLLGGAGDDDQKLPFPHEDIDSDNKS